MSDLTVHPTAYLVDDQTMFRAAFRLMLESLTPLRVVGSSADPRAAIDDIARLQPDVVFLDIALPGISGLDAIPLVRKCRRGARILMLSNHRGEAFVAQALKAGADGYLSKDSNEKELIVAVEAVMRGDAYVSASIVKPLLDLGATRTADRSEVGTRVNTLTTREREVFMALAMGRSNKEIARALAISLGTVKKHRENLQRKLDCHSAAELALLAVREGLMPP